MRAQQGLDDAGPGRQAVSADQDLLPGMVNTRTAKGAQSFSGAKQVSIVAEGAAAQTFAGKPAASANSKYAQRRSV